MVLKSFVACEVCVCVGGGGGGGQVERFFEPSTYFTDGRGAHTSIPKKTYSKTCLKRPLSIRPKMGFQDQLSLNAGQKHCRMLQLEHSAILLTCIELPHGFKTFVLTIFEWPLKTGFTVYPVIKTGHTATPTKSQLNCVSLVD